MRLGGVYVDVKAKIDGYKKNLLKAEGYTETFDKRVRASLDKTAKRFAVMASVASVAFIGLSLKTIKYGSDLEETQGKFDVVFRGMEDSAESWSKNLRDNYAMAETESKKYLSSLQDLLVPTGLARDHAGALSNEFVKLAADLGSFNNMRTEDVVRDIQSALQGSSETMAKYGVNVKQSKVEQEIFRLGLAKTKDEITDADKAQAIYSITMRQSSDAFGDMARTSDSYANQLKKAQANVTDLTTEIGRNLLPVATEIISTFNNWYNINKDLINQGVPNYVENIGNAFVFLIDAGDGVLRVFEIVGSSIALTALQIEKGLLVGADGITKGPIAALNNLIELINKVPGVPTVPILQTSNTIQEELNNLSGAVFEAEKDINSLFETDLAGTALLKSFKNAKKEAESFKKTAKTNNNIVDSSGAEEAIKTAKLKEKALEEYTAFYDKIMLSTYELEKNSLDAEYEHFKKVLGDKEGLQIAYNTKLKELQRERDERIVGKVDSSLSSYFEEIDAKTEAYKAAEEKRLEIVSKANQEFENLGKTRFELEREQVERMTEIYRKAKVDENVISKIASDRNLEIAREEQDAKLNLYKNAAGGVANTFRMIAQANGEQSKKAFKMQKAFAIVEAGINVYQGVTKALATGGIMGILNGALVAAAGAAQISMIANSQPPSYDQGGISNAGGVYQTGPIQEAHVPIPSGKIPVTINNKSDDTKQPPPQVNIKNINVLDPAIVNDYLDTSEGEQVIVNIMQRNRSVMEA